MGKFKIGDRVRALVSWGSVNAGEVRTVEFLDDGGEVWLTRNVDGTYNDYFTDGELELVPTPTIESGRHYRTRSGKVTGRVSKGDAGFEAVVDGKVRIYDEAGGHVHGDADLDIVEAWVPRVGERVRRFKGYNPGSLVGHEAVVRKLEDISHYDSEGPWLLFEDETSGYATSFEPLPVAAEAQPAAAMKIEVGRYYKTRDGRKVGPMKDTGGTQDHWTADETDVGLPHWHDDGSHWKGRKSSTDLIAEWQDTPAAPVAVQVDTIAEEYGPAPTDRKLLKTGQGYGYELARFGDYVWVDIGKTSPVTLRADKIAA